MRADEFESDWGDSLDDADAEVWESIGGGPDDSINEKDLPPLEDDSYYCDIRRSHDTNIRIPAKTVSASDSNPFYSNVLFLNHRLNDIELEYSQKITQYEEKIRTLEEKQQLLDIPSPSPSISKIEIAALDHALQERDISLLTKMLEAGMAPDIHRRNKRTPLMFATYRNDIELATLLLSYGADPRAVDVEYDSPIRTAIKTGGEIAVLLAHEILRSEINLDIDNRDEDWAQSSFPLIPSDGYIRDDPEKAPIPDNRVSRTMLEWCTEFGLADLFEQAASANYDVFGTYNTETTLPTYHPDECWEDEYDLSWLIAPPDPLLELAKKHKRFEIAEQLLRIRDSRLHNADKKIQSLSIHEQSMLKATHLENLAWFAEITGITIEPRTVESHPVISVIPSRTEPDDPIPF